MWMRCVGGIGRGGLGEHIVRIRRNSGGGISRTQLAIIRCVRGTDPRNLKAGIDACVSVRGRVRRKNPDTLLPTKSAMNGEVPGNEEPPAHCNRSRLQLGYANDRRNRWTCRSCTTMYHDVLLQNPNLPQFTAFKRQTSFKEMQAFRQRSLPY